MNFKYINYILSGNVAIIELNSPDTLNAFCMPMYDDVLTALKLSGDNPDIKSVILSAVGKAFCAGGDISEMKNNLELYGHPKFDILAAKAAQISDEIMKMSKPVIAAVHNAVTGAAFNITLSCDIIIAAEHTRFAQSFIKLGLIPDAGGFYVLSKAIGVSKAKALVLTGDFISAEEGLAMGFVYKTCKLGDLRKEALSLAEKMAAGPSKAYAAIKELIYKSRFADFEEYTKIESEYQDVMGRTRDFTEGVNAFLEKRPPVFTGK